MFSWVGAARKCPHDLDRGTAPPTSRPDPITKGEAAVGLRPGQVDPAMVRETPPSVETRDEKVRTRIDYRPINAVTTIWERALPRIKDIRR